MPTVKVSDIDMYYEIHGEGDALVLIRGFGSDSTGWFRQIPGLSLKYSVIAFDNRGTGRSDKPDIPYTIEMMARDTAGLLDALAIDAANVYGVSMGGMIAQEFALRYPERVINLILGCTHCGGTHSTKPDAEVLTFLLDFLDTERVNRLTREEIARESLPFSLSREFIDSNPDIVEQFVAKTLQYPTPPHVYKRHAEAVIGFDAYNRLPEIKAPTLVITGTADRLVPVENSRILDSTIPNAELVILENVGHQFFIEAAEDANKAILDFLRRHPRPS